MPNWVANKLKIEADEALVNEILDAIKKDEGGRGTIDFNKLIPMPEALNITSGSLSHRGTEVCRLMMANGITYHGDGHFEFADLDSMTIKPDAFIKEYADDIEANPEMLELGRKCLENIMEYGSPTWYEWCATNWGTKWNAQSSTGYSYEDGSGAITFDTAWSSVPKIIEKIAGMFPEVYFKYQYADEDLGSNVGELEFSDGGFDDGYLYKDGSKSAFEFAAGLWGVSISGPDAEYMLSRDESTYVFLEGSGYDLIDLYYEPALYSPAMLTDDMIPKDLQVYTLREKDDRFITISRGEDTGDSGYRGFVMTKTELIPDESWHGLNRAKDQIRVLEEGVCFRKFMDSDFPEYFIGIENSENIGGIELT